MIGLDDLVASSFNKQFFRIRFSLFLPLHAWGRETCVWRIVYNRIKVSINSVLMEPAMEAGGHRGGDVKNI